jgi:uncharacterized protein YodC (DUF2158 family)
MKLGGSAINGVKMETGTFKAEDLVLCYRPPRLSEVYAGNHVMLASGGPRMIVTEDSTDQVSCKWEDETGIKSDVFDIRTLTCYGAK